MLRTTLVVASMRGGGAERVVSHMANYWARKGWPVTVLTLSHGPESPSYALDPRVDPPRHAVLEVGAPPDPGRARCCAR